MSQRINNAPAFLLGGKNLRTSAIFGNCLVQFRIYWCGGRGLITPDLLIYFVRHGQWLLGSERPHGRQWKSILGEFNICISAIIWVRLTLFYEKLIEEVKFSVIL